MDERVCERCPRRDACPGTENRTCLRTAVELVAELAARCARLQELFDAAMEDLTAHHPEGRCDYCRYKLQGEGHCAAAGYDCRACQAECKCGTCESGSNWAWRIEAHP